MNWIEGGLCAPGGFRASGAAAGVKPGSSKLDCALVVTQAPASAAGVFTRNLFKAAPVLWSAEVCARGTAHGVFLNSGNANACTGEAGYTDSATTAQWLGAALGVPAETLCICSTGVIGVPLPMARIEQGVAACVSGLSQTGSSDAAAAIMTTDTKPKEAALDIALPGGTVRLGGIAKGAGMIAPHMATMLCVITTDAAVDPKPLQAALKQAVDQSFNCICVDNDMSTNDTVLCLANGASGVDVRPQHADDMAAFTEGLAMLCQELAKRLVRDGEGATKFVEISVSGAVSDAAAKQIAKAVASSQLCKTAFFGQDPNWGRIACAAGYSGAAFDPGAFCLWIGDVQLMDRGQAAAYEETDAAAWMQEEAFPIRILVGEGPGRAVFWTSDLSHDYVRINADYRT